MSAGTATSIAQHGEIQNSGNTNRHPPLAQASPLHASLAAEQQGSQAVREQGDPPSSPVLGSRERRTPLSPAKQESPRPGSALGPATADVNTPTGSPPSSPTAGGALPQAPRAQGPGLAGAGVNTSTSPSSSSPAVAGALPQAPRARGPGLAGASSKLSPSSRVSLQHSHPASGTATPVGSDSGRNPKVMQVHTSRGIQSVVGQSDARFSMDASTGVSPATAPLGSTKYLQKEVGQDPGEEIAELHEDCQTAQPESAATGKVTEHLQQSQEQPQEQWQFREVNLSKVRAIPSEHLQQQISAIESEHSARHSEPEDITEILSDSAKGPFTNLPQLSAASPQKADRRPGHPLALVLMGMVASWVYCLSYRSRAQCGVLLKRIEPGPVLCRGCPEQLLGPRRSLPKPAQRR